MIKRTFYKLVSDNDNLKTERTILTVLITFVVGLVIALNNGLGLFSAVRGAFIISVLTGAIVAVLAWGVDIAKQKGYSGTLGFISILLLNVFGILLLLLLPPKK
jgi:SNF family Na+-dependent transporter